MTMNTLALFCRVIDNYGDIGICYRLAKQLVQERQIAVTLWVDDLVSFRRLCPDVKPLMPAQHIEGIEVIHWCAQNAALEHHTAADIVIEFFGCELPPNYLAAMRQHQSLWINLEGLSAEDWVEGCHTLPSPQSGLDKYFFYPGFTSKTGGLLREAGLLAKRHEFLADAQRKEQFLARLGVTASKPDTTLVTLFCYPHAPVADLFRVWQHGDQPIICLVPAGVASEAVLAWTEAAPVAHRGALTVQTIPFLPQTDYDTLLWCADINFVRGEDSLVRAHWAQQPFFWHIYPQDAALHHIKLQAFLNRSQFSDLCPATTALTLAWNNVGPGQPDWSKLWREFIDEQAKISNLTRQWVQELLRHGDLATNLWDFCTSMDKKRPKVKL